MTNNSLRSAALALSALVAASAVATTADAKRVRVQERVEVCSHNKSKATTGTVVGAVGGGLLGNAIGGNTGSTLLGAGAGAVAGHEIAKGKKRCHWETRWVYRNR